MAPRSEVGAVSTLQPSIELGWSVPVKTTQFSNLSELDGLVKLVKESDGTKIPLSYVSYTASRNLVTLQPSGSLENSEYYRITVSHGIQDTNGFRSSIEAYTWTFFTTGTSIGAVEQYSPNNATIQTVFPTLAWNAVGATGVTYQLQIDDSPDFNDPVYANTTAASSLTPAGSFSSDATYYWRVRAYTGSVTGEWSTVWSFFYGTIVQGHATSQVTYRDNIFAVTQLGWEDGESLLGTWPDISVTFSSEPASSYQNYIQIYEQAVLARTDVASSYYESSLDGSWALSGNTATFTPSGNIGANTRYVVKIKSTLPNVDGVQLGTKVQYYFVGRYTPFYASRLQLLSNLRQESLTLPDDLINFYIHIASLEANARYRVVLFPGGIVFPGDLSEDDVRDQTLEGFDISQWTEAAARFKIFSSVVADELRTIGRRRRTADWSEETSREFLEAIKLAKQQAADDMAKWDDIITGGHGTPRTAARGELWSECNWNYDLWVGPYEGQMRDF
jgi:hypothetical protein